MRLQFGSILSKQKIHNKSLVGKKKNKQGVTGMIKNVLIAIENKYVGGKLQRTKEDKDVKEVLRERD